MIYTQLGERLTSDGYTNIRYDFMPESPDNVIVIVNTTTPQIPEVQGHDTDMSGIQIIVRNTNSQTAYSTARGIYEFLVSFRADLLVADGNYIIYTLCDQNVSSIGPDDKNRHTYTTYFTFRHERYERGS